MSKIDTLDKITLDKVIQSIFCIDLCTKDFDYSPEEKLVIFQKKEILSKNKDLWMKDYTNIITPNNLIITLEEACFSFEKYKIIREEDLFPADKNPKNSNILYAIQNFVSKVEDLNKKSLEETGKKNYCIPGLDYLYYLYNNQDKIPNYIKDGNFYVFPDACFFNREGKIISPCSIYYTKNLSITAIYLNQLWPLRLSRKFKLFALKII